MGVPDDEEEARGAGEERMSEMRDYKGWTYRVRTQPTRDYRWTSKLEIWPPGQSAQTHTALSLDGPRGERTEADAAAVGEEMVRRWIDRQPQP